MALVKGPSLSIEARGTTGPIVFAVGISGPSARRRSRPVRRVRSTQPKNRTILGFCSRFWGVLSDAQREAWRDYAVDHPIKNSLGDSFVMSGINAFIMLNSRAIRIQGSGGLMGLPPSEAPAAGCLLLTASTGVGVPGDVDLIWTMNGVPAAADFNEVWIAGPFQSQGRVEVLNQFRYIDYVAGNVLLDTIGSLLEGFWYWFRVRYVDQYGQATAWVYDQATPMLTP